MKQLSTVLPSMQSTATQEDLKAALSLMQPLGLTKNDGITTTARNYALTNGQVEQILSTLRVIRSYRRSTFKGYEGGNFLPQGVTFDSCCEIYYDIPEDFNKEAAKMISLEAVKPLGGATIEYLRSLSIVKKIRDMDSSEAEKLLKTYLYDLKGFSELAIIAAIIDLRKEPSPWFPTIGEIIEKAKTYQELIDAVKDFA